MNKLQQTECEISFQVTPQSLILCLFLGKNFNLASWFVGLLNTLHFHRYFGFSIKKSNIPFFQFQFNHMELGTLTLK